MAVLMTYNRDTSKFHALHSEFCLTVTRDLSIMVSKFLTTECLQAKYHDDSKVGVLVTVSSSECFGNWLIANPASEPGSRKVHVSKKTN